MFNIEHVKLKNACCVSQPSISGVLKGIKEASISVLKDIALSFECSVECLI